MRRIATYSQGTSAGGVSIEFQGRDVEIFFRNVPVMLPNLWVHDAKEQS
jgi:hypothetical protein